MRQTKGLGAAHADHGLERGVRQPLVRQQVRRLRPVGWVQRGCRLEQVPRLVAHGLRLQQPTLRVRREADVALGRLLPWRATRRGDVDQDAKRPHVGREGVVALVGRVQRHVADRLTKPREHLRRGVCDGPSGRESARLRGAGARRLGVAAARPAPLAPCGAVEAAAAGAVAAARQCRLPHPGGADVREQRAALEQEQVLRLDVTVGDAGRRQCVDRHRGARNVVRRFLVGEASRVEDMIEQIPASQRHGHGHARALHLDVHGGHDEGVGHPGGQCGLQGRVAGAGVHDLDCHGFTRAVEPAEHLAEAAGADVAPQLE
mmetsp:Transcript_8681/g.20587  ORF Transcript_8681/g.20587 Transcript_8681/m.20587 type:complete len:318 (-) Transcript_8681:193-1146(-)